MELTAQIIGLFGTALLVSSFLQKTRSRIILTQMLGSVLFAVQYLLFGIIEGHLYIGFMLNLVGIARSVVYMNKEKLKADGYGWFFGFLSVYVLLYLLNFSAFGLPATPFNLAIELLPVIGVSALTYSYRANSSKLIRYSGLINSPAWLVYHIAHNSIGGIICEVICIISVLVGIYRYEGKSERQI